eukprot:GHVL01042606.1.p2 GENE.GHVL01042606.1~~GHVL01042606.1.p2  ORF type:complete len:452 (+),score=134.38 GHVL01042606.1:1847-3202(+)
MEKNDQESENLKKLVDDVCWKIWKKNSLYLYEYHATIGLDWPSMTIDWLPNGEYADDHNVEKLIIGNISNNKKKYNNNHISHLYILSIFLPDFDEDIKIEDYDKNWDMTGFGMTSGIRVRNLSRITVDSDIYSIKHCPINESILGVITTDSYDVEIYDWKIQNKKMQQNNISYPSLLLCGLDSKIKSLCWNNNGQYIVCGSDNGNICIWDYIENNNIKKKSECNKTNEIMSFRGHIGIVEELVWSCIDNNIIASCGSDGNFCIWDIRSIKKPSQKKKDAHIGSCTTMMLPKIEDMWVITGGIDELIHMWDRRWLKLPLHTFYGHKDVVRHIKPSPSCDALFASCGDTRAIIWDMSKIGEKATEAPAEMLFIHGGHKGEVLDVSWSHFTDTTLASVDITGMLQVWQPSDHIMQHEGLADRLDYWTEVNNYPSPFGTDEVIEAFKESEKSTGS